MTLEIVGLPAPIRVVPTEPGAWRAWAEKALAYRVYANDRAARDLGARNDLIAACAADPLHEFLVVGCIFEPRDRVNADGTPRPPGWYPWIPYHFQGAFVRFIEAMMAASPGTPEARLGRGDGIAEKARGMAGSWTVCGYAGNRWRHADGFVTGMMSYKEDLVDKRHSTDSLFYKTKGYLGLDDKVPAWREMRVGDRLVKVPVRPPSWMVPDGFNPHLHTQDLIIAHPTMTSLITGYSTGERSGTGGRSTLMFMDEGAKFPAFSVVWNSMTAVTDHRLTISSPDTTFGTGFRDLARHAERACANGTPGASFVRMRPEQHPERDEVWREEVEARHSHNPFAQQMLAREYDLDYEAGHGAHIYPRAQTIEPKALVFRPGDQALDFCIDPGIRDMTAFHLVAYDSGVHRYQLLASYANSGKPADFYASLVCASPLGSYDYGDEEWRIMEWFDQWGAHIRFWVGDPAGKHRGGGQATSFYDDFRRATSAITDGRRVVNVWSSDKNEFRFTGPRIAALRWLLDLLDVNDQPDTIRTLEALRDHRFKALKEGQESSNPLAEPVRTWGIDRVAALEYYACHRKVGSNLASMAPVKPIRVTMGGNPWKTRKKKAQPWAWGD